MSFLDEDFLLQTKTAQKLYHEHAKNMPIIDCHCHLSPEAIANDRKFENLTQIWLEGEHYKWRAMRTNGIAERFCTGTGDAVGAHGTPGKIQFSLSWWFLDQKESMEKQLNALSNMGLLSRFVGMLTDSRSFLSYPRHECFRRILCNLIGNDVENGELPASEMDWLGQVVEDISYNNAKSYFSF